MLDTVNKLQHRKKGDFARKEVEEEYSLNK